MSPRALRLALIGSIVLNVFVLGAALGAAIGWRTHVAERPLVGLGRGARLRQAAHVLPPPERIALHRAIRQAVLASQGQILAARAARAEEARLMAAPTLDTAALAAAMARARAADIAVRGAVEDRMVASLGALPQPHRVALVAALRQPPRAAATESGRPDVQPASPPEKSR